MKIESVNNIKKFIIKNKNKRIIVIGTTCTGKSTMLKNIPNAQDMDELIFPQLTKEQEKFVCQTPWTIEIGKKMSQLVVDKIKVEKGKALFGTVVLDCDLIIYLDISDKLLKERTLKRNANYNDAKNMQKYIFSEIKKTNKQIFKYNVI